MTALEQLRARWTALAPRERRTLALGGIALALILAYLLVWAPVTRLHHKREVALADARALAVQLEKLAAEVQAHRGGATPVATSQSLLALVDQTRKASSLTKPPSRLEPEGDSTVRIWMEDAPFDALVRWLGDLQTRYGVRVDAADIERQSGSGLVNARLTLMKG
jgi:general secretion pathway protein M